MSTREKINGLQVEKTLYDFIEQKILSQHPTVTSTEFWPGFAKLLADFGSQNKQLLAKREKLQSEIDSWNKEHQGKPEDIAEYKTFLEGLGYLVKTPAEFKITTENVDTEISEQFGPQLVVPVGNARYAINAANARWGSLYDALYGTDVIDQSGDLAPGKTYNIKRGAKVVEYAKNLLDEILPLKVGSHFQVTQYSIVDNQLAVTLENDEKTGLVNDELFVGYQGSKEQPDSILFKHNGLHLDLLIDRTSPIGKTDLAGVKDIILEAAVTTIMDLEDSTVAVDGQDKALVYQNWLSLNVGDFTEPVTKNGKTFIRKLNQDKVFHQKNGTGKLTLKGRSLLFIRNVGHLMTTPAILDANNEEVFEGILDGVITALIAPFDFQKPANKNSEKGSVYIVKPKMHGPEEAAFANDLFAAIEELTKLPKNTLKIGVMDEERRTSVNLAASIHAVKERLVFINTGFLDRTGDEIHTNMYYGAMVRKGDMKKEAWFNAYEANNVQVGLACGLAGKAQIGKGMWAMPDKMAEMVKDKINQPKVGATTAWVPSPTAATLHAIHYHQVDVHKVQQELLSHPVQNYLDDILKIPVATNPNWSTDEIKQEVENNCQGILGYVVRWIEQGVGCSKVPDIHDIGLMEDRATCRISSQHLANWLLQKIITAEQVDEALQRMAKVVDEQNKGDVNYEPMVGKFTTSCAYLAARDLIFKGLEQPSGYTEPILHAWRLKQKSL